MLLDRTATLRARMGHGHNLGVFTGRSSPSTHPLSTPHPLPAPHPLPTHPPTPTHHPPLPPLNSS